MSNKTAVANAIILSVVNTTSDDIRAIFGITPERADAITKEMTTFLKDGSLNGDSFNQLAAHFPDPNEYTLAVWQMAHGAGLAEDANDDNHTGFGDDANPLAALMAEFASEGGEDDSDPTNDED